MHLVSPHPTLWFWIILFRSFWFTIRKNKTERL